MSYEYKDTIQDSIIHYYDHVLHCNEYTEDVLEELDHVYEQASKADEYEAKAKAWDKTQDLIKDCTGQFDASGEWDTDWCAFGNGIDEIIDEYESGESEC